jgi:hypothetical protein
MSKRRSRKQAQAAPVTGEAVVPEQGGTLAQNSHETGMADVTEQADSRNDAGTGPGVDTSESVTDRTSDQPSPLETGGQKGPEGEDGAESAPETPEKPQTPTQHGGRFRKGQSGNPGGRRKRSKAERDAIDNSKAANTKAMLRVLVDIALDKNQSARARTEATNAWFDRTYGKPALLVPVPPGHSEERAERLAELLSFDDGGPGCGDAIVSPAPAVDDDEDRERSSVLQPALPAPDDAESIVEPQASEPEPVPIEATYIPGPKSRRPPVDDAARRQQIARQWAALGGARLAEPEQPISDSGPQPAAPSSPPRAPAAETSLDALMRVCRGY